jgi:phosphoribosylformimino-5-aminoimidazole carboxamide ribotide isomerase
LSLIIFPAIDLKAGQVVRLAEGDMDRATIYGDDPAAQALLFAQAGAEFLHVVDLDGAFAGQAVNAAAVEAIVKAAASAPAPASNAGLIWGFRAL